MQDLNFCIIGNGRTARAMCAYLTRKKANVYLLGRDPEKVKTLCEKGITVSGCCEGEYFPNYLESLEDALAICRYVLVMTTSDGHLPVAKQLKGKIHSGQRIIIFNGNWGAYEFYTQLKEEAKEKHAVIAETGAMIFLADYIENTLHIKKIKNRISLASIPSQESQALIAELSDYFPQFYAEENVLCTSFNNSNPVIHGPVTLFNIARVENGEDYLFYADGASRSVIGYIEKIDAERCAVARAVGAIPQSCLQIINSFWPDQYDNLYDAIRNNQAYMTGKGPQTTNYRYINEDIPFGLAPISAIGKKYHVATPFLDSLLMCFDGLFGNISKKTPDFSHFCVSELVD